MKNSQYTFLCFILLFFFSSCNIDEIPPEIVSDIRGWFTIESNNIGVNLTWSEVADDDIDKYVIFKSTDNAIPLEIGETQSNYFKDSNVEWLESYQYFIRSVDNIGNESELSDSVLVRVYSASGNWEFSDYDSTFLCIDHNQVISTSSGSFQQKGYFLTDGYELVINDDSSDSTASIGDTIISKMLFSSCNLDSNTWDGNGWMTFQTTILDTTILGDTINTANNNFPVYFNMKLIDPESGKIEFSSPMFEDLRLKHALQYCNGSDIFN